MKRALYPFHEDAGRLERYCKLPLHTGSGKVASHGDGASHPLIEAFQHMRKLSGQDDEPEAAEQEFAASFLVPADGNCLFFLRWPSATRLVRHMGRGLTISGESPFGPFELTCPEYYVRANSESRESPGWSIAAPRNCQACVTYGEPRPIAKVEALINNFDFEYGDPIIDCKGARPGETLRIEAAGRPVEFTWRKDRVHLRKLLDACVLSSTSLSTFSFAAWEGASEEELVTFVHDISSLCCYLAGQHTGIPVLSFLDSEGRPVKRLLAECIESEFRGYRLLPYLHLENGLAKLFRQSFEEHVRMRRSALWTRMPALCAAIEDPPYLEQKYATLMMAVELLIRNSLIEGGFCSPEEAQEKTLPQLVSAARGALRWVVPGHYTAQERYREVRNAVDHGNELPHDPAQVRHDFDKWRLFLKRRLLIRLGYDGQVASPEKGFASSSSVDEFSEKQNSFGL